MKNKLAVPITVLIGVLLCSAARVFTIAHTDMKLGSVEHGYILTTALMYFGAAAAAAVAAAVLSLRAKKDPAPGMSGMGAVITGFGLLIAAMTTAYDAVINMSSLLSSGVYIAVSFIFSAILGVAAFMTLYNKEFTPLLGFIYSLGALLFAFRGVYCFMTHMIVTAVPEYFIEALSSVFGAVFFVVCGRLLSGGGTRSTRVLFCAWGAVTASVTLSALIGAAAAKLMLSGGTAQRIVLSSNEALRIHQERQGIDAYMLAFPSVGTVGLGLFAAAAVTAVCLFGDNNEQSE